MVGNATSSMGRGRNWEIAMGIRMREGKGQVYR